MKIKGLFSVMLHQSYVVVIHWNIIVDTYRNPFSAGLGKCRHLRVKSMPLAFTGIFRNNPEYSGITWHFRKIILNRYNFVKIIQNL